MLRLQYGSPHHCLVPIRVLPERPKEWIAWEFHVVKPYRAESDKVGIIMRMIPDGTGIVSYYSSSNCFHSRKSEERVQVVFGIRAPDRRAVEETMKESEPFKEENQELAIEQRPSILIKPSEELS
ncbi:hypothetical protein CISG_09984 [Coccidioides immitis RMSCC 3703]|uniref:Uncharacterized protein n=2 Tax=Coccidioides immitis TaxID=5501 RepID=A0A0J8QLH6_COCIT|nr:hypothetical protein CIRG_09779 [Coccidioides immitis RMSCC 2394]KMU73250.1 hypothetical protein CISG_09984 [Coccidioides immitis RMSCC 3703]